MLKLCLQLLSSRLALALVLIFTCSAEAQREETSDAYLIHIRGTINPATSHYLNRTVKVAEEANAEFVLVELDTPGGLVSSVREMAQTIDQSKIPVIVYTTPAGAAATSAGAILMISSHLAAMAPGTNIGAAHPVGAQGEDIEGAMGEKAVQDIAAFARSMAALRKRNSEAAAEVVLKSRSYTADEAIKAGLIEVIASDRSQLFEKIEGREMIVGKTSVTLDTIPPPQLLSVEMTLGEKVLSTLSHPNIAAILMTLGILLIYAELSAPGLGLPGIAGAICLLIAFISFQALPIQTGGLVLITIGIALVIAEIFVGSGGVLAVGGSVALVLGLLWVIDPVATDLKISREVIWGIGLSMLAFTLLIGFGVARLRKQASEELKRMGGGDTFGIRGYRGTVKTLDPGGRSGQILIRGELWKFASDETLNENDLVNVIAVNDLELKVNKIRE